MFTSTCYWCCHPHMQDTLGEYLLWEGQSYKPGYHGNKSRTLTWLNDEVVLRTFLTSMSMNMTLMKCGDVICASSWMLWIRCIQRSQVLLVIYRAACVNNLLFAEQNNRWCLKWQDFDWLAGWFCVCMFDRNVRKSSVFDCVLLCFIVIAQILFKLNWAGWCHH